MPFVIFALPRSRTAWLSKYLTYGGWSCGHEELRHVRSLDDVKSWLSQPNTGTAETAAAPWWRTLSKLSPDTRIVVVRRPVEDVVESMMRLGLPFDRARLTVEMRKLDRKLDQIERRMPNVLSVSFYDLALEDVCAQVFEHCLPYKHDHLWWETTSGINVQADMPALMRYMGAYQKQLAKFGAQLKCLTLADLSRGRVSSPDDLLIAAESFETFYRDAQPLFAEHLSLVNEWPDAFQTKNVDMFRSLDNIGSLQVVTARSNGRMAGYLMTVIAPSLKVAGQTVAMPTTIFASKEFPRLGRQLHRFSTEALRDRGVDEVMFRAGTRGDGPRLAAFYRRLGAEEDGQLFNLQLN